MDRKYWEKIAPDYDEEIFDVLHHDKKGLIRAAIKKYASKNQTAIDIGCAIGKWLPVLSPLFKKVIAVDISAGNLAIAKKLHSDLKNVEYLRSDASGNKARLPKADFGICINAILTSSMKDRNVFFRSIADSIKKGGRIIITVPSLESYLLTNIIANQWKIDRDLFHEKISPAQAMQKWNNIKQGNADIDNVPHKHYLEEELDLLLSLEGFRVEKFHKIEYDWTTEFIKPPKWLKHPRPWDWMVVAKKV